MKKLSEIILWATYPIIGNLSENLQERILGHNRAVNATAVSIATNPFLYAGTAYFLAPVETPQYKVLAMMITASIGCLETFFRNAISNDHIEEFRQEVLASPPGKLISIPIEYALNIYDRHKK